MAQHIKTSDLPYEYEAFHLQNLQHHHGMLYASNEREARLLLREQALIPTTIQLVHPKTTSFLSHIMPVWQWKIDQKMAEAQWQWIKSMSILEKEGLSFSAALEQSLTTSTFSPWNVQLTQLQQALMQGLSLKEALTSSDTTLPLMEPLHTLLRDASTSTHLMGCFAPLLDWHKAFQNRPQLSWHHAGITLTLWVITLLLLTHTSLSPNSLWQGPVVFLQNSIHSVHHLLFWTSPLYVGLLMVWLCLPSKKQEKLLLNWKKIFYKLPLVAQWHRQNECHAAFLLIQTGQQAGLSLIHSVAFAKEVLCQTNPSYPLASVLEALQNGQSLNESLQILPYLPEATQQECTLRAMIPSDEWLDFFERQRHLIETELEHGVIHVHQGLWVWGLGLFFWLSCLVCL